MNFIEFADWALKAVLGGCALYGVSILNKMKESIDTLNVQVARIITKDEFHEKILEEHGARIRALEQK